MPQSFVRIRRGIRLGHTHLLPVSEVPGNSGDALLVPNGAVAFGEPGTTVEGQVYTKKNGSWVELLNADQVKSLITANVSYRGVVALLVTDDFADLAAAEVVVNAGDLQGVGLVDGSRVLFTGIIGATPNVYVVTGTLPATLVEESNAATEGDLVFITQGTGAGAQLRYDGSTWETTGHVNQAVIDAINAFVGRGTGPADYPDNTTITDGTPLKNAIGFLAVAIDQLKVNLLGLKPDIGTISSATSGTLQTLLCTQFRRMTLNLSIDKVGTNPPVIVTVRLVLQHNGRVGVDDATVADFLPAEELNAEEFGVIDGLEFNVALSGAGADQAVVVTFVSNTAVTVKGNMQIDIAA